MKAVRLLVGLILVLASAQTFAEEVRPTPPPLVVPSEAQRVTDPVAATRAWLATVPPEQRARSDAYYEGGYWLLLWNWLASAAISILLLQTRISARLRDFAERTSRSPSGQIFLYAIPYILITSLLAFPLIYYESFVREHAYEMATQTFGAWFGDRLKDLMVDVLAGSFLLLALYRVFRKAPRTWWLWGTGVAVIFLMIGLVLGPVYIEPLFNTYKPITDPKINEPILELARANNIPVTQVFEVDASRQTKRISANVAGLFGTTRIALNDNLLTQCTLPEIRHVMGHEMGHYVLKHMWSLLFWFTIWTLISFAVARWAFAFAQRRWGEKWGVRGLADPAGLPLLALIFATVIFLLTPAVRTTTRVSEIQADRFALDSAREPDGAAAVALKLGVYRKLDPTPLEEFIFFTHPSGRARIQMAMEWKAGHLPKSGE